MRLTSPGLAALAVLLVAALAPPSDAAGGDRVAAGAARKPRLQATDYHDGHARPRALAFNDADGLLYVALSTADELAVVDPGAAPRVLARVPVCRFPAALAAAPGGGVLVACRFEPGLRRVRRDRAGAWRATAVDAGPDSGARGLALAPSGGVAYVASPAARGIDVVALPDEAAAPAGGQAGGGGGVVQTVPTGISPRALRVVPAGSLPGQRRALLLASTFVDHVVTVHPIADDGRLLPAVQLIKTDAPVLDMVVTMAPEPALLLLSHEDRPLSRARGSVEGNDSVVLRLPAANGPREGDGDGAAPFLDPGPGLRDAVNLSERAAGAVIELAAGARDPASGAVAVVGAGSDNLLIAPAGATAFAGPAVTAVEVGTNPTAVAALPGGRWVTADRLSDGLTFVEPGPAGGWRSGATLLLGAAERRSPAERGEVLFYGRALVPNNVADGPLSLYTCAGCHDDGHVDGRRHPSKRNRFYSMTKSCRGLGTTAPYLSLGEPDTIEAFADNIVATHAQGADRDPERFDKYPVTLRLRARRGPGWQRVVLSPAEVRAALVAYMAVIPPEPSPYVTPGRRALSPDERRGLALFRDGCSGCHQLVASTPDGARIPEAALDRRLLAGQVALTSPRNYDVGTPVLGRDGNNPPSLRGVWDAAPYFSDGSARTLDEVLARTDPEAKRVHAPENATRPAALSPGDRAALLSFLRAL